MILYNLLCVIIAKYKFVNNWNRINNLKKQFGMTRTRAKKQLSEDYDKYFPK